MGQFVVFTGASERVAIEVLKRNDWNLEAAVDSFFSNGGGMSMGRGPSVDSAKIGQLFDKFVDKETDCIQIEGLEKFCQELGVDPTDKIMLLISWQMKAKTMCVYTRDEW